MKEKIFSKIKKATALLTLLQLLLITTPPSSALAASTAGPNNGTVFISSGFGNAWANPNAAAAQDSSYSSVILPKNGIQYSSSLEAKGFNFNIPTNATVNGITVNLIEKKSPAGTVKGYISKLIKNGTQVGTNKEAGGYNGPNWPTTDTLKTYGNTSDLWGTTWTPAEINNPDFGYAVGVINTTNSSSASTAYVDYINVSVSYTVAIPDTTPPVIAFHDDVVAEATSPAGAIVNYTLPIATDNIDSSVTVNCAPEAGSLFPLGDTIVTCNASDTAGNAAIPTEFYVYVQDTTTPIITLNGPEILNIEFGTQFTDPGAIWSDNIDGTGEVTAIYGDTVNTGQIGTYNIIYSYADNAGNYAEINRTVNVVDNEKPVITLNGNNEVTLEVNTPYSELGATWSDTHDGTGPVVYITSNINTNLLGDYQVKYNFTDASGNAANEVIRTIHVVDTAKPIISLIGDIILNHEALTDYVDQGATAADNYDGDLTSTINVINSIITSTLGSYSVTYDVTDSSGNEASQVTRTVNVVDTTKPTITLNGLAEVVLEQNAIYSDAGATAVDNYDGNLTSQILTNNSVDTTTVGTYTVTYDVKDSSNNAANQATRTVRVNAPVDNEKPVITLNGSGNINVEVKTSYVEEGATWTDNVDGNGDVTDVSGTIDTNVVGDYIVRYNFVDSSGNRAEQVTRTIHVRDTVGPVVALTVPGNGQRQISRNTKIFITFNEKLNPATVNLNNVVVKDSFGMKVRGQVTYDSTSNQIVFTPSRRLWGLEKYKVTVSNIKDLSGNVGSQYKFSFKTSWR